jgi:hypothetical protein
MNSVIQNIINQLSISSEKEFSRIELLLILKDFEKFEVVQRKIDYLKGQEDREKDICNLTQFDIKYFKQEN